ncbi:6-phosphogluconate dehydrogenase-like protein [Lojkania enalia]|uniref:6-phosphogluconate dehydrogenase-like protein n=1 Tax=Lojkania enalia TaxID=147567 RepID=A0A9P4KC36_9PLEO|nr:6-phosphogluconate dehydrogenase-like protein [Didymosphaeria enalia]
MALQFAFVGIGPMGEGMSENLIAKGNLEKPLIMWNRTKERATAHSAKVGHSTVADTLHEVVTKADVIWSCLQDEAAITEAMNEMLNYDVKGKLFVDSSTISPKATNEMATRIISAGAEFVALPVFGEPPMAKLGLLTMIPAGDPGSVSRIMPYLSGVVGRGVVDLSGEEPGKASLLKFIGNVAIFTSMEAVAEMNVFAEKTNLGAHNIQKLLEGLMPVSPHVAYVKHMLSGEYWKGKPGIEVSKALVLTSQVLNVAKANDVSLKSYEVAVKHLEDVQAHSGPSASILGIYGAVREESGLPFEN